MKTFLATALLTVTLAAGSAQAQPRNYPDMKLFRSEARLSAYYFDNFYQATDPRQEDSVEAAAVEYRGAYRPAGTKTDFYGHLTYMWWNGTEVVGSYGGRAGVANDGDIHSYNIFVDRVENRPSFEIGNVYGLADTTTLNGEYSYRFTRDWEPGIEARRQTQKYEDEGSRDNDFTGFGANVRYHGWELLSPTVGFERGKRKVSANPGEAYDADDYYVEVVTEAIKPLWIQLGYHSRGRSYSIGDRAASNFGREDSGPQLTAVAAWRQNPRLSWTVYLARESVNSERARTSSDFTTNLVLVGLSYGF